MKPESTPVEPDLDNASEGIDISNFLLNYTQTSPQTEQTLSQELPMKKITFFVLTVFLLMPFSLVFLSCSKKPENSSPTPAPGQTELTIYAYDSFVSEWGPGPFIIESFEKETGIKINMISSGDSGQVLQKIILEKSNPKADIVIGIDNNLLYQALNEEVLLAYKSSSLTSVPIELHFDPTYHITPYDYGYFAFIYDTEVLENKPESLSDLLSPEFNKKIIIMDPRTSSPGLGLLHWTVSVFQDQYLDFWEQLKPNLLTVTDGWDTGYGLFTAGEAPIVLSYTTSPAYHVEYEDTERYQALVFDEGHYLQIEGAGIVNGTKNLTAAKLFIDFLLSEEVQEELPLTNWMYPVVNDITLPDSYNFAPKPEIQLSLPADDTALHLDKRLEEWTELMSK